MSMTAQETSPLLPPGTPVRTRSTTPPRTASAAMLLKDNLFGDPFAWVAQARLFSYHPALQSVAILGFTEGVLLLQPTKTVAAKKTGLALHQVFQYTALPVLLAGSTIIIYNKLIHSAPHLTSWHGLLGLITLVLILIQITFGVFMVYTPLTAVFGGETKAKSLWKFHRASGYIILTLLMVTPLTAIQSDWLVGHSTKAERVAMVAGLALMAGGITARISVSKLGLRL